MTAQALAADFGPKSARAQGALGAIQNAGGMEPVEAYYRLVLECLIARATGRGLRPDIPFGNLAAQLFERVSEYATAPEPADVVKELYSRLFTGAARHRLGEYYTPDWLAEKLLAETFGADLGDPAQRVLDPACGSGTFLVLIIKYIRRRIARGQFTRQQGLDLILRNVAGFDVNPLAVQAARANYMLALGDLLPLARGLVDIPVYRTDLVLAAPSGHEFDYIIGNPPWVNWQNLPHGYRRQTMPVWEHYGLFPKRQAPMETILGGAKYDVSMLMTYVAADRYLRQHGRLGFIVSQTLFKTGAAGRGFRRFRLPDGTPLAVRQVDDMTRLKPFDCAANRTATLVLEKGRETVYPVPYRYHRAGRPCCWAAQPICAADPSGSWMSAPPRALEAITKIVGASQYRAREGANTGGANAVFWLEIAARRGQRVAVRNVTEGARKQVPAARARVEAVLVYPLLRGQNVARWSAVPEQSILITHRPGMKLRAIPETEMKRAFPGAFAYLKRFAGLLRARPAYRRYFAGDAPFYSLFNIGDYTFAPWKVVWREQALPFTAAVVGPAADRAVAPDHKLMAVAVDLEDEAHYLCGVLNSLPVSATVAAYAIETQIDTHVLDHIRVPRFNANDELHQGLAAASRRAHRATRENNRASLQMAEDEVNQGAAKLWGLTEPDLVVLREFLRESGVEGHPGRT